MFQPHPSSEDIVIVQENEYCQSERMTIFIGIIYAYKGLLLVSVCELHAGVIECRYSVVESEKPESEKKFDFCEAFDCVHHKLHTDTNFLKIPSQVDQRCLLTFDERVNFFIC